MTPPLRKITIFSLLLALAAWGVVGVYHLYTEKVQSGKKPTADVRQQVLTSLEKDLEFCQVVKEDGAEFWLICNGRPFYAVYEDGEVSYELNGWSFLQNQPEILKELQGNHCRLYQTTDDQTLDFICEDENVRKYAFSTSDFKLTKLGEGSLLDEIVKKSWVGNVLPCQFVRKMKANLEDDSFVELTFRCQGEEIVTFFNPEGLYFSLPGIANKNLSPKERAQRAFNLLDFGTCKLKSVEGYGGRNVFGYFECSPQGAFGIDYNYDYEKADFRIREEDFISVFPLIGKYIFPFLELESKEVEFLTSRQDKNYYLVGNNIIILRWGRSGFLEGIYLKTEGLE